MRIRLECLAALTLLALDATAVDRVADKGLRFDSAGVLDLAERSAKNEHGAPLPVTALAGVDADRILAAPARSEDEPVLRFSDDEFACKPASSRCSLAAERKLIDATGGNARRDGRRLTVRAAQFVDWKVAETNAADGDEETHWYLGRLPGSGYDRVEVQFGHDAPGNFLINPQSGKVAFVHNGADLVAPSPDGLRLVTYNALKPPLTLRVAALDNAGPRLELECAAHKGSRITAQFKGWHDAASFDLVLAAPGAIPLAVRIAHEHAGWTLKTRDASALRSAGIACQAPADS